MPKSWVPQVVLIAGGSGSGKTTLANSLAEHTSAALLSVDRYYRGYSDIPLDRRRLQNFDSPDSIEHELLTLHLHCLLQGETINAPRYDAAAFARFSTTEQIVPKELVIVEGLFALHWEELRRLASLSVFMDTCNETCLRRRLDRDTGDFARSSEDALLRYHTFVKPNYEQFVSPTRRHADLLLDGASALGDLVNQVQKRLSFLTMLTNA